MYLQKDTALYLHQNLRRKISGHSVIERFNFIFTGRLVMADYSENAVG